MAQDRSIAQQPDGSAKRTVFKDRIKAYWFADNNQFWYRNRLPGESLEYIRVDAVRGQRTPAFDHARLAEALSGAGGREFRAEQLELDGLKFVGDTISFRIDGKFWNCDLATYAVSETEGIPPDRDHNGSLGLHPDDAPRTSTFTGPETELRFVNRTDREIELLWLDGEGKRRSYGKLAAGAERRQHTYIGHVWLAMDRQGDKLVAFQADENQEDAVITTENLQPLRQVSEWEKPPRPGDVIDRTISPDGRWIAFTREGNLFLSEFGKEETDAVQLSSDGSREIAYTRHRWSPDSRALVSFRVEPGEPKEVYRIESSPDGGGRAVLHRDYYALPGDKFPTYALRLYRFDQSSAAGAEHDRGKKEGWRAIPSDAATIDFGEPHLQWSSHGNVFRYTKVDRGHQRYRLIEVDTLTGCSRNLIDEQTDTFIWTAHTLDLGIQTVTWLDQSHEFIYLSEVDGWRHLYLIDPTEQQERESSRDSCAVLVNGKKTLFAPGLKTQITKGNFVVRGVDQIDEDQRQIWFRASGRIENQDPYFIHYYRVNFDGSGLVQLTEGNGNHSIQYSPDRRYFIDTYSRVDSPPSHELRRSQDGQLICKLEQADITQLEGAGWRAPEVFTAKGRDGTSDIWGIICRPQNFDPNCKYPVIEDIYAGPHDSFVPKSFSPQAHYQELTELGFIVVKIDGMGTANRSKAFHDVCWQNLKDAGFPDRILWMKSAAQKYPYFDLERVGIYGTSAGGQNAAGAVLFHSDFYRAASANCGCHDNRMDKASWNEQWMGYPVGPHYSECSNIDNAHRLGGQLQLILGELDTNVPPESTHRLVDALVKANKAHDFVFIPGGGHGAGSGGRYHRERMHEFFVRHLIRDD